MSQTHEMLSRLRQYDSQLFHLQPFPHFHLHGACFLSTWSKALGQELHLSNDGSMDLVSYQPEKKTKTKSNLLN